MLAIQNVTKTFHKNTANANTALDNISLEVNKGDFITIIGGNGAGKSTLLNAISGQFWVDSGRITLDGQDITYLPEHRRARSIGRLFQDPLTGTAPSMTLEENLALAYLRHNRRGISFGLSKDEVQLFRERLSLLGLGLEDRLKIKMGLLSGGQRQAVTLLMSTLVAPKLLLLDEHTAALDPATADKVLTLTKQLVAENNITTLMITHNIGSALELGNRTIMMDRGHIVLDMQGEKRKGLTVEGLLQLFKEKAKRQLDNDRMLLS